MHYDRLFAPPHCYSCAARVRHLVILLALGIRFAAMVGAIVALGDHLNFDNIFFELTNLLIISL